MEKIIEICCGSYEDCINAWNGGAKRVELNSALHLGGLTPSLASLKLTKENTGLKVICMVRPRGAGFHYTDLEYDCMKMDARLLMENGSDGLAFGFLLEDGTIDEKRTKEFVELVHKFNGEAVFHRAFDCVKDPFEAIEKLITLGVDRILTSGLEPKAMDGIQVIKELQEKYGDRIELLAGSGMNATNALEMMNKAGVSQVHSSCKDWVKDPTTTCHHVTYAYASNPHELDYDVVSCDLVSKIVASVCK